MNTHFKKAGHISNPSTDDDKNNFTLFDDNNDGNSVQHNSSNARNQAKFDVNGIAIEIQNDEIEDDQKNSNNSTTYLSIEAIDVSNLESLIYNQISDQLIRMTNAALTYNESQTEMKFLVENVQHTLHTAEIDANGNAWN